MAIGHLIKTASYRLLYRVLGSLSFVAAARSVLLITADPDHPDRRVLSSLKTVFGPTPPPLSFRIVAGSEISSEISNLRSAIPEPSNLKSPALAASNPPAPPPSAISILKFPLSEFSSLRPPPSEISNLTSSGSEISNLKSEISSLKSAPPTFQPAPHLVWDAPDATRPWQLRADLLDGRPDTFSALAEACDWLWNYLAAGPQPARDLLADAHQSGLNIVTLRRAKRLLSIRSTRNPDAPGWLWHLSFHSEPPPQIDNVVT